MNTKPLWHNRSEEPVFVEEYAKAKENGRNAYVRIAFLASRPLEPGSDTLVFTIETMRVYREDRYGLVSWEIRSKEEDLVKWCYFDELVSDDVQIPDKEASCCGYCAYWTEHKSSKDYGQCIEWCAMRHKDNWCFQFKRREGEKKKLEFVEYTGKYPNLCSGRLFVKIDGKLVSFGEYCLGKKGKTDDTCVPIYHDFWQSGGCAGVDDDGEEFCTGGEWKFDSYLKMEWYPKDIQILLPDLLKLFNQNVPLGCCGGCI